MTGGENDVPLPPLSELTDRQLVDAWQAVNDDDPLKAADQAIIDEMERRQVDF
jgi:hypothetical protein